MRVLQHRPNRAEKGDAGDAGGELPDRGERRLRAPAQIIVHMTRAIMPCGARAVDTDDEVFQSQA